MKARSMAGTSWIRRAVGRYSLWSRISWVSPERPSTSASASVQPTVTAYVVTSSQRHLSLAASAEALPHAQQRDQDRDRRTRTDPCLDVAGQGCERPHRVQARPDLPVQQGW